MRPSRLIRCGDLAPCGLSDLAHAFEQRRRGHGGRTNQLSTAIPPSLRRPPEDEHGVEVLTRCDRVPVLLYGREAVSLRMVMRGAGETFHVCDGTRFLEPAGAFGSLCGCPASLADRRAAAQAGRGPTPEVRIDFRLADLPELGVFDLVSASWELAAELPALATALDAAAVPVVGVRVVPVGSRIK
ncbi:hypothetical protein [Streptomyces sp. NPDC048623]|uniref:recombination directionality factor n=1 Tax=Streptomyces sp. NPDC048623 TaxID=3155761 RepID=UPI00341859A7